MRNKLQRGDWVRSKYQAQWYGKIVEVIHMGGDHYIAEILEVLDRRSRPFRKPRVRRLDCAWLEKLDGEPKAC